MKDIFFNHPIPTHTVQIRSLVYDSISSDKKRRQLRKKLCWHLSVFRIRDEIFKRRWKKEKYLFTFFFSKRMFFEHKHNLASFSLDVSHKQEKSKKPKSLWRRIYLTDLETQETCSIFFHSMEKNQNRIEFEKFLNLKRGRRSSWVVWGSVIVRVNKWQSTDPRIATNPGNLFLALYWQATAVNISLQARATKNRKW